MKINSYDVCNIFLYKHSSKMLDFSLKIYNLQNVALNVIIIKKIQYLKSSHTDVYVRLSINRIKSIYKEVLPNNTAD